LVTFAPSYLPLLPHTHIVDEKSGGKKKHKKKTYFAIGCFCTFLADFVGP